MRRCASSAKKKSCQSIEGNKTGVLERSSATMQVVKPSSVPADKCNTLNADIVVLGSGASGIAAALAAAEGGAKVIMLEKQAGTGGTGNFAEGIFAADSSLQRRQGIIVTTDMAFRIIMDYSHWLANPRLVRAFVNKSADTIEWLKAKGVEFEYIGPGAPGGIMTWHVIAGHSSKMLKILRTVYESLKGQTLLNTCGKSLIVENGKIAGVIAENSRGDILRITAKAVIIGTGGYVNNKKMLIKYTAYPDVIPVGNVGKDGDGIRMAWVAGAAEEGVDVVQSYRPGLPGMSTSSHLLAAARQPYFWVDARGRRFTDESTVLLWPFAGNSLAKAGGVMFSIFDSDTKKLMVEEKGLQVPIGEWVVTGTKLAKLDYEIQNAVSENSGNVAVADTIPELARQLNMDVEELEHSIAENNGFATAHQDSMFAKNPGYLRHVQTPPFYAIKMLPMSLGTLGGVRINERTEAINAKGDPVPGLYVVGNDAGGMYGDSYDLLLGGGTLGFAVNSGRIAAENALAYSGSATPDASGAL